MKKTPVEVVVLGGGGFAAEVIDTITLLGKQFIIRGVFDDDLRYRGGKVYGVEYCGTIADFVDGAAGGCGYILAIGDNAVRARIAEELNRAGRSALTLVHPSAVVSPTSSIGAGTYVSAGVFVGPRVEIGAHVIVNVGVSVGHDAKVEDYAQLCPGARVSGYCRIGRSAFMGSNSAVAPGKRLGENSKLTACSFAARDVPAEGLAVGVPARVI